MKRFTALAVGLLGIVLAGTALGKDDGKAATKPSAAAADPMTHVIPEVNFQNVSLDDAVQFLQDAIPDFRAVVVRDPGIPQGYPALSFRLKKVDLTQLVELIQMAHPDVQASPLEGGAGTIYIFRVSAIEAGAGVPGAVAGVGGAPSAGAAGVHVYRLSEVVDALVLRNHGPWAERPKDGDAETKQALNNVLSLIKATLAQADGAEAPVLQVHEETCTLIFKGRESQRAAIEDVLSALQPAPSNGQEQAKLKSTIESLQRQVEEERKRAAESVDQAKLELSNLRVDLQNREKEYRNQAVELDRLRARLEDLQKSRSAEGTKQ